MHVIINGQDTSLHGVETVSGLLGELQLEGRIAVEVNREIVPRSEFDQFPVRDGDVIEIVRAIGGG